MTVNENCDTNAGLGIIRHIPSIRPLTVKQTHAKYNFNYFNK